jgi:hypothetical protein
MWHRQPGDPSSMGPAEQRCPAAQEWVQQEVGCTAPLAPPYPGPSAGAAGWRCLAVMCTRGS